MKKIKVSLSAPKKEKEFTIKVTGYELPNRLPEFLKEISKIASGGHGFMIEADREDRAKGEKYPTLYIDGDGGESIEVIE